MAQRTRKLARFEVPLGRGIRLRDGEDALTERRVFDAKELGEALKARRRELGYTQETAAGLCAHSVRVVGDIERGRETVGIGIVFDYAAVLDVDLVLLVRGRRS